MYQENWRVPWVCVSYYNNYPYNRWVCGSKEGEGGVVGGRRIDGTGEGSEDSSCCMGKDCRVASGAAVGISVECRTVLVLLTNN